MCSSWLANCRFIKPATDKGMTECCVDRLNPQPIADFAHQVSYAWIINQIRGASVDRINKWMTLVANFGVVAGIIFLGIEIQQNTNMMQAQSRSAITQNTMSVFAPDLETADIIVRGLAGEFEPGSGAEFFFFQGQLQRTFKTWENEYYQYKLGLYEKELFTAHQDTWAKVLRRPGARLVWRVVGDGYSPQFRQIMDLIIQGLDEVASSGLQPSS